MRFVWTMMVLLCVGCRGEQAPAPVLAQQTPAETALHMLEDLQQTVKDHKQTQAGALRDAAVVFAAEDPTTRMTVSIVATLSQRMRTDPNLQLDATFAATAPGIAARMAHLRQAFDAHTTLLESMHMAPLPPEVVMDATAMPSAAFTEAAVHIETLMDGRWPLKRVFVAYAVALDEIRVEAEQLSQCTEQCPAGVAAQAVALQQSIAELMAELEAFASLHC